MTFAEIKRAITELSPRELKLFRAWFAEYCAKVCDKQIEEDAKSGRLDKLIAEAEEEKALIEKRRHETERPLREYLKEKKN